MCSSKWCRWKMNAQILIYFFLHCNVHFQWEYFFTQFLAFSITFRTSTSSEVRCCTDQSAVYSWWLNVSNQMSGRPPCPFPVLGHNVFLSFQYLTTVVNTKQYLFARWKAKVEIITDNFRRNHFFNGWLNEGLLLILQYPDLWIYWSSLHLPGYESEKQKTLKQKLQCYLTFIFGSLRGHQVASLVFSEPI